MVSLSNQSGQRPLRASLRQAQTDRLTHLERKHVMGGGKISGNSEGNIASHKGLSW